MGMQEIFDHIVKHLAEQGRAFAPGLLCGCCYRTPDGKSCAVGCLIDEENYDAGLEGKDVGDLYVLQAVQKSLGRCLSEKEVSLLASCQSAHDWNAFDDPRAVHWDQFKRVAARYGLSTEVLEEVRQ